MAPPARSAIAAFAARARRIAEGSHNDAVARQLGISPHTARRHTERVLAKLSVTSRAQISDRISFG